VQCLECFKKYQKRKIAVTKKSLLMFYTLLSLLIFPAWVSAEIVQDQPVRLINFNDLLLPTSTVESFENSGQDEEFFEIFAGPVSEAHGLLLVDSAYGLETPSKLVKAKMKVLTCHVTSSTTDTTRTTFPWVSTEVRVAHIAFFEILNKNDFVKFKVILQGPEFSQPLVVETPTFGPQEPLNQWAISYNRTYSVPGLYKIKMTGIPKTNHISGRSSAECSFRVSAPQASE
jgi:hypothetical protein